MRELRLLLLAAVLAAGTAGCREGSSEHSAFCAAVRDFTVQGARLVAAAGADDAPQQAREDAAKMEGILVRLDATAPPEIEQDVRATTDAYRTSLRQGRPADASAAGERVRTWAEEHCDGSLPGDPRPTPTEPPAPTDPPVS